MIESCPTPRPQARQREGNDGEVWAADEGLEAGIVAQAESVVAGGDETAEFLEWQTCHPDGDPRETNRCFCFALLPSAIRKIALLPFALEPAMLPESCWVYGEREQESWRCLF